VRRIDVAAKAVHWSESGSLCAIASADSVFVLKYDREAVDQYLASGAEEEDGCEGAFEPEYESAEKVSTGRWIGDCFVYISSNDRLNYLVGGEVQTLHHLDRRMYLLGYMAKDNRLYLIDKEFNVVSYEMLLAVLEYKTCIVRKDYATAKSILPSIPADHRNKLARFLETQDLKEEALQMATDPDYRFELAIQLKKLDEAYKVVAENESDQKWRQLGDLVIANGNFPLAAECLAKAKDHAALLLLYSCQGNRKGVQQLAQDAADAGKTNIAFLCNFLLGEVDTCLGLLTETGRTPEAAFLARTYAPSHVSRIVEQWRADLTQVNAKAAESLADPTEYPNLFPDFDLGLVAEQKVAEERNIGLARVRRVLCQLLHALAVPLTRVEQEQRSVVLGLGEALRREREVPVGDHKVAELAPLLV
jgi:coatomer subunit beta'